MRNSATLYLISVRLDPAKVQNNLEHDNTADKDIRFLSCRNNTLSQSAYMDKGNKDMEGGCGGYECLKVNNPLRSPSSPSSVTSVSSVAFAAWLGVKPIFSVSVAPC